MYNVKHFIKHKIVENPIFNLWFNVISRNDISDWQHSGLFDCDAPEECLLKIYCPPKRKQTDFVFKFDEEIDLSIILPVFNVEQFLDDCLSALLQQNSKKNFEILAINDGSTDSSLRILKQWQSRNDCLKIINRDNGGLSAARNTGISEARGKFISFVDSDDIVDIQGIWDALDQLKKSEADYISGNFVRIDVDNHRVGSPRQVSSLMVPWGRIFKRKVWSEVRFPEGYWYEDLVIPYLVESRFRGLETNSLCYLYRNRPGSIVNSTIGNPKGLDSFWLISIMLDECLRLDIPFEKVFEITLYAMGPTLLNRSTALTPNQMKLLFLSCCNLVNSILNFSSIPCKMGRYWNTLRHSLVAKQYKTWCASCLAIALEEDNGGAKRALQLLKTER